MEEQKSSPIDIHDLVVDRAGVRLPGNSEWSRTLADAYEQYGHDNMDLFVLERLPITAAEKLEIYRMVLTVEEEKS